jgi:hypothetical protein
LLRRSLLSVKTPTKGAGTPADSSMLRSYFGALVDVASWKVAFVSLLTVCVSLTSGVGLLLLVPLLQVVGLDVGRGTVGPDALVTKETGRFLELCRAQSIDTGILLGGHP